MPSPERNGPRPNPINAIFPIVDRRSQQIAEMLATVSREYPNLDIDLATRQIVSKMSEVYEREVKPRFEHIQREIASTCAATESKIKESFGYKEVYDESDLLVSRQLLTLAREVHGLAASYSEEHGPYSDTANRIMASEESLSYAAFWQFDPIDGSRRFSMGKAGFTMQAALLVRCADGAYRPLIGVVYDPIRNETWFNSACGKLFFLSAEQERIISPFSARQPGDRSPLLVHCSSSGRGPLVEDFCGAK